MGVGLVVIIVAAVVVMTAVVVRVGMSGFVQRQQADYRMKILFS